MTTGLILVIGLLSIAVLSIWRAMARYKQDSFVRNASLPPGLLDRLAKRRPELSLKERMLVARGLRQFFLAYLRSDRRFVSMPSQVGDDLWHEFILYTRHYDEFCRRAFGRFLHHTPAVVLGPDKKNNAGLRRAWWYACKEENINPRKATRVPLLLALDSKLGIADGYTYSLDCHRINDKSNSALPYCAGDFGDSSVDGGTDGFGDGGGTDSGDGGSGDGGGSGCGGGCGGD